VTAITFTAKAVSVVVDLVVIVDATVLL